MMIYNNTQEFLALEGHYPFLKKIAFNRSISTSKSCSYDAEIILSTTNGDADMRIRCVNALDIKVGHIEGLHGLQVSIKDITDWQHEGCNYLIVEEEGAFSFSCEAFFVELIK